MAGISPKLPLAQDPTNGYALNPTWVEATKQNLTSLILTVPGERIMDPDFGVGIKKYLFELDNTETFTSVSSKIYEQVSTYLPYVEIVDLSMVSQADDPSIDANLVFLKIVYVIKPLEFADNLLINVPRT